MTRASIVLVVLACAVRVAYPAGSGVVPVPNPPGAGAPAMTAESRYNKGVVLAAKNDWQGAEAAYRDATRLKPNFPEAWNGLGHALKNLQRYDESVRAYQEALRLRPNYAQALEYLGEAYVQMGKTADARRVLERLRPLDGQQAATLERAIGGQGGSW